MIGRFITNKKLGIAVLILALLGVTAGRGYWNLSQCLHANLPHYVQPQSGLPVIPPLHPHDDHTALLAGDDMAHQFVHVIEGVEYSLIALLPLSRWPDPGGFRLNLPLQILPDVSPVRLYRPPRNSSV